LSRFAGRVPVELNAGTPFPPIGHLTYLLTLPPFGFYWFLLRTAGDAPSWHTEAPEPMPAYVTLVLRDRLITAFRGASRATIEGEVLSHYLGKRRWFGAKEHRIESAHIKSCAAVPEGVREMVLCEVEAVAGRETTRWLLLLAIAWEDEPTLALPSQLA